MKPKLLLVLLLVLVIAPPLRANENVVVINPASKPVPVTGTITATTTGLATSAKQDTGNTSLASAVTNQTNGTQKAQVVNTAGTEINTATTVVSTALEASHVLKASAGRLVSFHAYNSSASAQYILIMNSATVPANGAVTLLYPPIYVPATSNVSLNFTVPLTASTGISVSNSSTGTFTKTIGSADCAFTAQVQ